MKMKRLSYISSSMLVLLFLWHMFAWFENNEFILPFPSHVLAYMGNQLQYQSFYETAFISCLRAIIGLSVSLIVALFFAYISYRKPVVKDLLYPVILLTRSIPNISYILIVLILFSRHIAVIIVLFLILFPVLYSSFYTGFQEIGKRYHTVMALYPDTEVVFLKRVYLPLLKPIFQSSISSGISLAFKVCVMAEILGGMQQGIGRQLNLCRLNFDMIGLFAWTGWMILLLILMDCIIRFVLIRSKEQI